MRKLVFLCLLTLALAASGANLKQERFRLLTPLGLDEYFFVPEDNPLTPQKIALGRRLFFDKVLSADRSVACASCHKPELAFSDGLTVSIGVGQRKGTRHAPALINRAYGQSFFWDGRARTLEEQALGPIQHPAEMNLTLDELMARLKAEPRYAREFKLVFADGLSTANVARSLASFIRTLRSGNSAFDQFQQGQTAALSAEARRGLNLFRGRANCVACHPGPNFTDEQYHNTGISWGQGDLGRYEVSGKEKEHGAFKTPTLREIARTAPYMHDGSLATLDEVLDHYNRGGVANPYLDTELRPLRLTIEEKQALIAFLKTLSGSFPERN